MRQGVRRRARAQAVNLQLGKMLASSSGRLEEDDYPVCVKMAIAVLHLSMPMSTDLNNLGKEAFFDDNYPLAHTLLTEAIKHEPSAEMYADRAQVQIKLGKYIGALEDCNSAIEMDGALVTAFYRKGIALKHMDLFESAKTALEDGLKFAVVGSRIAKLMTDLIEEIAASISRNSGIVGNDEALDASISKQWNWWQ